MVERAAKAAPSPAGRVSFLSRFATLPATVLRASRSFFRFSLLKPFTQALHLRQPLFAPGLGYARGLLRSLRKLLSRSRCAPDLFRKARLPTFFIQKYLDAARRLFGQLRNAKKAFRKEFFRSSSRNTSFFQTTSSDEQRRQPKLFSTSRRETICNSRWKKQWESFPPPKPSSSYARTSSQSSSSAINNQSPCPANSRSADTNSRFPCQNSPGNSGQYGRRYNRHDGPHANARKHARRNLDDANQSTIPTPTQPTTHQSQRSPYGKFPTNRLFLRSTPHQPHPLPSTSSSKPSQCTRTNLIQPPPCFRSEPRIRLPAIPEHVELPISTTNFTNARCPPAPTLPRVLRREQQSQGSVSRRWGFNGLGGPPSSFTCFTRRKGVPTWCNRSRNEGLSSIPNSNPPSLEFSARGRESERSFWQQTRESQRFSHLSQNAEFDVEFVKSQRDFIDPQIGFRHELSKFYGHWKRMLRPSNPLESAYKIRIPEIPPERLAEISVTRLTLSKVDSDACNTFLSSTWSDVPLQPPPPRTSTLPTTDSTTNFTRSSSRSKRFLTLNPSVEHQKIFLGSCEKNTGVRKPSTTIKRETSDATIATKKAT